MRWRCLPRNSKYTPQKPVCTQVLCAVRQNNKHNTHLALRAALFEYVSYKQKQRTYENVVIFVFVVCGQSHHYIYRFMRLAYIAHSYLYRKLIKCCRAILYVRQFAKCARTSVCVCTWRLNWNKQETIRCRHTQRHTHTTRYMYIYFVGWNVTKQSTVARMNTYTQACTHMHDPLNSRVAISKYTYTDFGEIN